MFVNKQEAAAYLGVSVRALQRYSAQGKLSVTYTRGSRGQVAQFDEAELKNLKERLEQPTYPQRPMLAPPSYDKRDLQAVIPVTDSQLVTASIGDRLIAAIEALKPDGHQPIIGLENKLTLKLSEAATISGLSRSYLVAAIHSKKLKAAKRGRGWNIKRTDLDSYIKKL
jgi:excisionase family DNA binding protein